MKTKLLKKLRKNNRLIKVGNGIQTTYYWEMKGKRWLDSVYIGSDGWVWGWERPFSFRVGDEYIGRNTFASKNQAMNMFMTAVRMYYSRNIKPSVNRKEIVWYNKE